MSLAHDQWRGVGFAGYRPRSGPRVEKPRRARGHRPHAGAPACIGRQHAVVKHEIDPRERRQGGQLLEQFERLEQEMTRAVRPSRLEREQHAAVAQELQPVLADRRTQEIAAQLLEPRDVTLIDRSSQRVQQ